MSSGRTLKGGLPPAFHDDLMRLVRAPSIALEELEIAWPFVQRTIEKRRAQLERSIPLDDPVRAPVDLLGPLRRQADETLHSLALAYLLDPNQPHGLGKLPMLALLRRVKTLPGGRSSGARHALSVLSGARVRVTVTPEYRHRVEGVRGRHAARADIWIEIRARNHAALVVIENKVNASESESQLTWYERHAKQWRRRVGPHGHPLLLFLTPDGRPATSSLNAKWVSLPYAALAGALRSVWLRGADTDGAAWLRHYLATLTRSVIGLNVGPNHSPSLSDLSLYLEGS